MDTSAARLRFSRRVLALAGTAVLAAAACTPQAAAPTAAPPKPAPTTAPAQPASTAAPAKVEAPAAKPAATTAPAAKPTEKPAAFDEKAVADFYKGKTVRIVVGFGAGGTIDVNSRMLQQVLARYIPGNPTVIVDNKPGGGGMLAVNTVYSSDPKDGTVIASVASSLVLQQAIGAKGVQYDAARFNWLGSMYEAPGACAARTDSGIASLQDIMGGGKELTVASYGKGTTSYDPPAVMNVALGTKFKIVTGYESGAAQRLAIQNKEVQGACSTIDDFGSVNRELFEGANPVLKLLVVTGSETPTSQSLKMQGVPAAESLAKTDEARALLKGMHAPYAIQLPYAVAPEVPKDRVQALRRAFDRALADPETVAGAQKLSRVLMPKTGEEVTRIVQSVLSIPPATLAKLAQALE